jgi:type II secretory pathway pseudopilin PulG
MKERKGFTLVEMLVVAPIIILVGMILLGSLIDKNGELQERNARLNLQLQGQVLLLDIQDELQFATRFSDTSNDQLTDPNPPAGGWDYNTSPDSTLIIESVALTTDASNDARQPVYYISGPNTGDFAYNNLIYFVSGSNLTRRIITPLSTAVSPANFRRTSCPPAATTPSCPDDTVISTNVKSFNVQYFDLNDVSANSDPLVADKVKLTLTLEADVNGKTVEETVSLTMKKLNAL